MKEIKDVRGPATEMIISPWQAKQQLLGGWPGDVGMEHERNEGGTIVAAQPLFHSRKREREAAIFIWPPCASLAPLSVTNGQVVNRKKAQKHRGTVEIKQHERNLHI